MRNVKLDEFEKFINSKKVAIIGLGVSNIPLIDYMHDKNAKVTVFDNKEERDFSEEVISKLKKYKFQFVGGKDNLKELKGFDIVFRSPSCLPTRPELVEEAKRGAVITSEIEMLMKLAPCKIIGVTGTEGKTTTSSIIYEIVKQAGYNCYLGGNMGNPIFTKIKEMTENDIIVLEMSSFQLMNMKVSPDISLVTNMYPDHLNIHSSLEEYQEAKKCIFTNQSSDGIVVLNYDNDVTRNFAKDAKGKVIFFSSKQKLENGYIYDVDDGYIKHCKDGKTTNIINKDQIKLKGIHNYENICAALAVTSSITDIETQVKAISEFKGVEHRLEFVREVNGVKYYNDSIGTSPASTIAGLNAFDENIILLAGGSDKGLDYTEIGEKIAEKVGTLILCGPTSDKIEEATRKALISLDDDCSTCKDSKTQKSKPLEGINIVRVKNMREAVNVAKENAKPSDVVLLSPASASFDLYKDFIERGKLFKELVNKI